MPMPLNAMHLGRKMPLLQQWVAVLLGMAIEKNIPHCNWEE
jgi:hypothetical protein